MDLEHKVVIVRGDEDALKLESLLNDGFVALRADKLGDNTVFTLAKAVKGEEGIIKPGSVPSPLPEFGRKK